MTGTVADSFGGDDGLDIVRRILDGAKDHLAPDGGLRVRDAGGERVVHSGEVSVRPAP